MIEDSSEFVSNEQQTSDERVELYRSQYFIVSKIRLFNKWRIEKRLTPEYEFQPIQRSSLEREFEIGYQLDHPNIVRYLELRKTDQGVPYIIMEYVDGMNLHEYMQSDEVCTQKDFYSIFTALLSALSYLQQRQIYHLDIKPENIVITYKEHIPKLIDFGVSNTDTYQTSLGSTKQYRTKEHTDYSRVSSKTDMYSFAKTMKAFADKKQIALSRVEKKILQLCSQEDPQKRLDARTALQVMQKRTNWKLIYVSIGIVLMLVVTTIFFINKQKQTEYNKSANMEEVPVVVENDSLISVDTTNMDTTYHIKKEIIHVHNHQEIVDSVQNDTQTAVDSIKDKAMKILYGIIDSSLYKKDSIFFEKLSMQYEAKYKEIISTNDTISRGVLKFQLLQDYERVTDSVIQIYVNENIQMFNALGKLKYLLQDELERQMDSIKREYKNLYDRQAVQREKN